MIRGTAAGVGTAVGATVSVRVTPIDIGESASALPAWRSLSCGQVDGTRAHDSAAYDEREELDDRTACCGTLWCGIRWWKA